MQKPKITPERLVEAVTRLDTTLQGMVSPDAWAELRGLVQTIQDAEDDQARRLAGIGMINWLAEHPAVRDRVHLELTLLGDLRADLQTALAVEAQTLGLAVADLDVYVEAVLRGVQPEAAPGPGETTRQVFVTPDKATLVSLRNVWLHPGELLEFLASAAFTAKDVVAQPGGVLVSFGVLWLVRSLYKLVTEEIAGADAAVLWGAWHACGRTGGRASLHRILEEANKAAEGAGLPLLTGEEVRRCLRGLERLGIVEPMDDEWLLREKCWDHPLASQ